jgi:SAM-dependent methyltransferase
MEHTVRQGEYGLDGNMLGFSVMALSSIVAVVGAPFVANAGHEVVAVIAACIGGMFLVTIGFYLHTTRRGKFAVWRELLDALQLRGDERVLDVGCGRGAVLTLIAQRLPTGRSVGIDLWTSDQSGNSMEAAQRNLVAEGVTARCELVTGDMREMPFDDASFDLVVSSLAVHNISNASGRERAIREIARVVAPGGRIALVDLAFTRTYARQLEALGFIGVSRRDLGWRFWWAPAVLRTTLVSATKACRARSEEPSN